MSKAENAGTATAEGSANGAQDKVLEARFLIENTNAGSIIGKQGATVKRIREETGAFISIFGAGNERILLVKGVIPKIARAVGEISMILAASPRTTSKNKAAEQESDDRRPEDEVMTWKLLLHKALVGAIIGKAGAIVKDLQAETNTRVQVANECLPNSTDKIVTIKGVSSAVEECLSQVLEHSTEITLKPGTPSFLYTPTLIPAYPFANPNVSMLNATGYPSSLLNPLQQQAFANYNYFNPALFQSNLRLGMGRGGNVRSAGRGGRGGGRGGSSQAIGNQSPIQSQGNETRVEEIVSIPAGVVGAVIGRGGAVVREIKQRTRCDVSIENAARTTPSGAGSKEERKVTLSGSPQAVEAAKNQILDIVNHSAQLEDQQQQQQPKK